MRNHHIDKIMILGTGFVVEPDGSTRPTQRGAERLDRALHYYWDVGSRATLLCSGGYSALATQMEEPPKGLREAFVMADYLMNVGNVPYDQIELEPNSTSTVTNFTYAIRDGLVVPSDYTIENPLGVVTHPYHMNRVALIADKLSLDIQAIPTEELDNKWHERRLLNLYRVALAGAHEVEQLEYREKLLAAGLNMLRR